MIKIAKITHFSDIKRRQQKKKVVKHSILVLIVILISLSCVYIFSRYTVDEIKYMILGSFGVSEEGGYPIQLPGGSITYMGQHDGDLMIANETNIYSYDSAGVRKFDVQHMQQNPVIKSCGKKLAVYDVGDNYYSIYEGKNKVQKKEIENNI